MACTTCKKTRADIAEDILVKDENKTTFKNIRDYILKFLLFIVMAIVLTPLLIPIFIVVLFKMVVLSKELNLLPIVLYLGKKIFKEKGEEDDEPEDDENYDDLNEDEYELVDEDEITELK